MNEVKLYDGDIEEKAKREYEQKYLNKFIEAEIDNAIDHCKIYFKVIGVSAELKYIHQTHVEDLLQIYVQLYCKSYIKTVKNSVQIYNADGIVCGFGGGVNYMDRFIKVIDKQDFKDILKSKVNNIIHEL